MTEDLPIGWTKEKLGQLTSKIGSGATPRGGQRAYKIAGVPLIRSMNVHFDGFRVDGLAFLDDEQAGALDGVTVKADDVLLNITGASIGRVTTAPADMAGARVNQHVCIIRPVEGIEPNFVARYLASPSMQAFIAGENYGVTRQALTKEMVESIIVPIPPGPEQRRIVHKIESLFARSTRARDELARIPRLIDRYHQAVLEAAFRGDLTADWRSAQGSGQEPAASMLRRLGLSGANSTAQLRATPDSWCWRRLDDIADVQGGLAKGKRRTERTAARLVPYLRVANVQRGHLDLSEILKIEATEDEIQRLALADGDVLFNEGGDRDKLGRGWVWHAEIGLCIHQNHVFRARIRQGVLLPELLSFFGNSFGPTYFFDEGKQTTNLASLSKSKLCAFPVPIMPIAEQREVLARIKSCLAAIDVVADETERAATRVGRLDQSILDRAFAGELVPQDPDDEPATLLLDRIKAARGDAPSARRGRRSKRDLSEG